MSERNEKFRDKDPFYPKKGQGKCYEHYDYEILHLFFLKELAANVLNESETNILKESISPDSTASR